MVATLNHHPAMEIQVVSHGLVPAPCRKYRQTEPCSLLPHSHPTWSPLHLCQPAANPTMALCRALSSWTADAGRSLCGRNALPRHGSTRRVVDNHPGLSCTEHPFTSRDGKCHALGKETHQIPSPFQIFPCCLWSSVTACTAVDGQTSSIPLPQCSSPQTCERAVNWPLSFNSSFPYLTTCIATLRLWGFSKSPSRGLKHRRNHPPWLAMLPTAPRWGHSGCCNQPSQHQGCKSI